MALQFHPKPGSIVLAHFPTDYAHGEMAKRRPVIVISKRLVRGPQSRATVVPISMTAPYVLEAHHVIVPVTAMPAGLRGKPGLRFAVCDCVNTLSLARLDFVASHRIRGRRNYEVALISDALLLEVRAAVAQFLELPEKVASARIDALEATR